MKKNNNKFHIMTYILAFSFWMILITWEGGLTIQTVIPFVFLGILHFLMLKDKKIKLDQSIKFLGIWLLIIVISTIMNSVFYVEVVNKQNLIGCLSFITIFIWFYLCVKDKKNMEEINFIFDNMILVATILSIKTIVLSLGGYTGKVMITNLIGKMYDENLVTAYVSVTVIISFIRLLFTKNKKIFDIFCFLLNFIGICLTGSRAALLACVLGMLTALMISFQKKGFFKMIGILLLLIGIGFAAINMMPDWIYNRYFNSDYMDKSNNTRLQIWGNALSGIKDQPILGFGCGTFASLKDKYLYTAGYSTPAHQTYLDIMLYSGLIGFIVFGAFVISILKNFLFDKEKRIYLPLIVNTFFISFIISATKTIFFWSTLILLKNIDDSINMSKTKNLEVSENE